MLEVQCIASLKQLLNDAARHLCPECGCPMTEVERANENGYTFVWYECGQSNCNGQWLEKMAR